MQDKNYFNVYYFDFQNMDYTGLANEVKRQMRIMVRDNQWKDIPVEDFEIMVAGKNDKSDTKPYRVNIIQDSAIHNRVVDTLTTAMYGETSSQVFHNVWPENLQADELLITRSPKNNGDLTVSMAVTTLNYLANKYAPTRLNSDSIETCAISIVRRMFKHFGMKSQVTRWSDKQI